jgi:hypothetical protein
LPLCLPVLAFLLVCLLKSSCLPLTDCFCMIACIPLPGSIYLFACASLLQPAWLNLLANLPLWGCLTNACALIHVCLPACLYLPTYQKLLLCLISSACLPPCLTLPTSLLARGLSASLPLRPCHCQPACLALPGSFCLTASVTHFPLPAFLYPCLPASATMPLYASLPEPVSPCRLQHECLCLECIWFPPWIYLCMPARLCLPVTLACLPLPLYHLSAPSYVLIVHICLPPASACLPLLSPHNLPATAFAFLHMLPASALLCLPCPPTECQISSNAWIIPWAISIPLCVICEAR